MKLIRIIFLVISFLKEVVVANVQMLKLVIWKPKVMEPALVKFPLDVQSDWGIFLFGSMITLTPGTLLIDISIDRKFIFVHITHTTDPEKTIRFLKTQFEKKLLEVGC